MRRFRFLAVPLILLLLAVLAAPALAGDAPRISAEELRKAVGGADLTIIDVRAGRDWTDSDRKIQGALRQEHREVQTWAGPLARDKTYVLYCA